MRDKKKMKKFKKSIETDATKKEVVCMTDDQTFNFVKGNYSRVRNSVGSHESTVCELESILQSKHKEPDKTQWYKSLVYWEKHYVEKERYKIRLQYSTRLGRQIRRIQLITPVTLQKSFSERLDDWKATITGQSLPHKDVQ